MSSSDVPQSNQEKGPDPAAAKAAAKAAASDAGSKARDDAEKVEDKAREVAKEVSEKLSKDNVEAEAKKVASTVAEDAEKFADEVSKLAKTYSENIVEELKDPSVSTTVLFSAVTASAASTYLTQQHKQGNLTPLLAAGVVLGVAALSVAEYFSVKAYFRRNQGSS